MMSFTISPFQGLENRPKREGSLHKELIDIDLVRGNFMLCSFNAYPLQNFETSVIYIAEDATDTWLYMNVFIIIIIVIVTIIVFVALPPTITICCQRNTL